MTDYQGISRNQLCPCGSGLRFKQCHGKISSSTDKVLNSVDDHQSDEISTFLSVLSSGLYEIEKIADDSGDSFLRFVQLRIADAKRDSEHFFLLVGNLIGVRKALKDTFGGGTTRIQGSAELLARSYGAFSNINLQLQAYQRIVLNDLSVDGYIDINDIDVEEFRLYGVDCADNLEFHLEGKMRDKQALIEVGKQFMYANRDYLMKRV